MTRSIEIGECPNCNCTLYLHEIKGNERYVKCEICGHAYNLPNKGKISKTDLTCPLREYPVLIVQERQSKICLWTDRACIECQNYDTCDEIQSLIKEHKWFKAQDIRK